MEEMIKVLGIKTKKNIRSWEEKFECERDEDESAVFYSKELFVSDSDPELPNFNYRYVVECIYDWEGKKWIYSIYLMVSPESLDKSILADVMSFCDVEEVDNITFDGLLSYGGCGVCLGSESTDGEEIDYEVVTNIANVFEFMDSLRGFYLDKTLNAIGSNGWDTLEHALTGSDLFQPAWDRYSKQK